MKILLTSHLIVKESPTHGYGVFAGKNFQKGEIIEECYTIIADGEDRILHNYYFRAGKEDYSILTGCGLIYNHSDNPNAIHDYDPLHKITVFKALKPIYKGEEILHCYGKDWFEDRNMQAKNIAPKPKRLRYRMGKLLRLSLVISGFLLLAHLLKLI